MGWVELHIFDGPLAVSVRDLHTFPWARKEVAQKQQGVAQVAGVLGVVLEEGQVFQSDQWKFKRLKGEPQLGLEDKNTLMD